MLYCEHCHRIIAEEHCAYCGGKSIREPTENDTVYLAAKDALSSGIIEEILTDNNVPYLKKGALGAGMTMRIGQLLETYTFYVPFSAYEKSKELLAGVFIECD